MAKLVRVALLAAFVLALWISAARADQIDGTWCSPAGKSMTIDGSRVVTPSGKSIIGNYTRHHFDYVVPDGDAGAGELVSADQIDDYNIQVTGNSEAQDNPEKHVVWKRCEVIS